MTKEELLVLKKRISEQDTQDAVMEGLPFLMQLLTIMVMHDTILLM